MEDLCNFAFEVGAPMRLLHGNGVYLELENYKYPIPFFIILILAG